MRFTEKHSGITVSGSHPFVEKFKKISEETDRKERLWIKRLRKLGVKAAHPNDGWVNREEKKVHFSYPYFQDDIRVGDKVALGWPDDYNIVRVTKEYLSRSGMTYYYFEEIDR